MRFRGGARSGSTFVSGDRVNTEAMRFRYIQWIPVLSILGVSLATALLWQFGPEPHREAVPQGLWIEQAANALQEPTDKLILFSWWLLPIGIVSLGLIRSARISKGRATNPRFGMMVFITLAVLALIVAVTASLWRADGWGYWRGISAISIAGGVVITAVVILSWRLTPRRGLLISLALIAMVAMFMIPSLLETASHLRDPYDFGFTGDELSAPAAGRWPLAGYVPQYTNLLGYPIAPLLILFGHGATSITVNWLILLQLVTIAGAISIPLIVSGRRMLGAAVVLVAAPLMISGIGTTQTPLSYFATMPLRTVLPVVLIVVALVLLPRVSAGLLPVFSTLVLGVLAGITGLNNADFGLPAVLMVAVALVVGIRSTRIRWTGLLFYLFGVLLVPIGYFCTVTVISGRSDPTDYLLYARTFALDGFYQEPMDAFGLHVAATALFVAAASTGAWLLLRRNSRAMSFASREGLALLLCGGWALLTMAYFAGRSLVPTFIGGAALQIGLVAAAFLPLIRCTLRRARVDRSSGGYGLWAAVIFSVVLTTIVSALLWQARKPIDSMIDFLDSGSGQALDVNGPVLDVLRRSGVRIDNSGEVLQLLPWAGLTQLETGIPTLMSFNSPEVFTISPAFVSRQCDLMSASSWKTVVIDLKFAEFLSREVACRDLLDFEQSQQAQVGKRVVAAIPRASSS